LSYESFLTLVLQCSIYATNGSFELHFLPVLVFLFVFTQSLTAVAGYFFCANGINLHLYHLKL